MKMFRLYFGPRHHVISFVVTNVADESAAFIFRVSDDGSSRFVYNISNHPQDYLVSITSIRQSKEGNV
jgi:hypothetical protein